MQKVQTAKCATHKLTYMVTNGCSRCSKQETLRVPQERTYIVTLDVEYRAFSSKATLSLAHHDFDSITGPMGKLVSVRKSE